MWQRCKRRRDSRWWFVGRAGPGRAVRRGSGALEFIYYRQARPALISLRPASFGPPATPAATGTVAFRLRAPQLLARRAQLRNCFFFLVSGASLLCAGRPPPAARLAVASAATAKCAAAIKSRHAGAETQRDGQAGGRAGENVSNDRPDLGRMIGFRLASLGAP